MSPRRTRDINEELIDTIGRLPYEDTFPFHSLLNPEYTPEHLLLSQTGANVLFILNKARQARELAISWRNFTVGASIMGLKASPSLMRFMGGVNIKPEEESVVNIHAEHLALKKLAIDGFDMVSMVAVVGEVQSDKQSGKPMHTLHPCGLCRKILFDSSLIDNERTLIVSALPDFSVIEISNIIDLQRFHEQGDASRITRFAFDEPLELLTPHTGTEPVRLIDIDTPQMQAEEEKWFAAVEEPLSERRHRLLGQLAAEQAS